MSVVQLLHTVQKYLNSNNMKKQFTNNRPGKGWFCTFLRRHEQLSQKRGEYLNRDRGVTKKMKESARSNKESITILFAVNASGTFAPSLTIFNYVRLPNSIINAALSGWGIHSM